LTILRTERLKPQQHRALSLAVGRERRKIGGYCFPLGYKLVPLERLGRLGRMERLGRLGRMGRMERMEGVERLHKSGRFSA
jgi:hypothetical protein